MLPGWVDGNANNASKQQNNPLHASIRIVGTDTSSALHARCHRERNIGLQQRCDYCHNRQGALHHTENMDMLSSANDDLDTSDTVDVAFRRLTTALFYVTTTTASALSEHARSSMDGLTHGSPSRTCLNRQWQHWCALCTARLPTAIKNEPLTQQMS